MLRLGWHHQNLQHFWQYRHQNLSDRNYNGNAEKLLTVKVKVDRISCDTIEYLLDPGGNSGQNICFIFIQKKKVEIIIIAFPSNMQEKAVLFCIVFEHIFNEKLFILFFMFRSFSTGN